MRIALLGTRGIPASYGGFETFAEELSIRLVERGHEVTVYCRAPSFREPLPRRPSSLPSDNPAQILRHHRAYGISTADLLFRRFDVVLYCNAANAVFTWMPRLLGMPTALNVDGLERHRKKWNKVAKLWYLISEWLSTFCCTGVVSDAERIREYYFRALRKGFDFHSIRRGNRRVPEHGCCPIVGA